MTDPKDDLVEPEDAREEPEPDPEPDADAVADADADDPGQPEPEDNTDEQAEDAAGAQDKTDGGRSTPAGPTAVGAVGWRVARVLLAPVLALAAVGLHFAINVPANPVIHQPRDQGAGAADAAAKRRAERAKRRREKRQHKPRAGPELDSLYERYVDSEFDREPVVGKWARATQTMLNKAIVMARKDAFEGAPEEPRVSVTRTQCRTIRCQMLLRSPYVHEVRMLASTLRRLETSAGENVWLRFDVEEVDPPSDQSDSEDHFVQITAVLIADGIEGDGLEFGALPKGEPELFAKDEEAPSTAGPKKKKRRKAAPPG